MASYVIYSDSSDNDINSTNATYSTARAGSSLFLGISASYKSIGQYYSGGTYGCYESFFGFDTSVLGAHSSISTAVLSIYGQSDSSSTNFTVEARSYDWSTTVTTGDWVAGASLSALTSLATLATSGYVSEGYNNFTDVAMPANVNKTGFTRIICCSSRMTNGDTPTTLEYVTVYEGGETGTTKDPKLTITTTPYSPQIKKIAGVSN
jgi:hypothetical protein